MIMEPKRLRADLKLIEFFVKVQLLAAHKKGEATSAEEADHEYR